MRWNDIGHSLCPVARSLSVVGDRWTLLILRELGMGMHRFEEMQAQIGMSSHLLATRLKRLEKDGVVEWKQYSERPARYEYFATKKGKELDAVLLALQMWGLRWGEFDPNIEPSVTQILKSTGEKIDTFWLLGDRPFTFDDTTSLMSTAFAAERDRRRAEFVAGRTTVRRDSDNTG